MNVLVTGGAGFVGSHLVHHLQDQFPQWNIEVVDHLGRASDVRRLRPDTKLIVQDLSVTSEGLDAYDLIFHLAAESHVDFSIREPVGAIRNNVMATAHVLELARRTNPVAVFMVSTDEVYGPTSCPNGFQEWDRHLPSNPYSASKAASEDIAVAYWRTYGVPVVITGTTNNFGERQATEKFLPKAIGCLLSGRQVPIHAGSTRIWLHARKHADGLAFLATKYLREGVGRFPREDRPPKYHIAQGKELSPLELADRVAQLLGVPLRYQFVDFHITRPGHDLRYALDHGAIEGAGWLPADDFEERLEETVRWYADHRDWLELA
jgi:dTDP-glucose 4,6-dehydratase